MTDPQSLPVELPPCPDHVYCEHCGGTNEDALTALSERGSHEDHRP
jgi:hypothetical protein